MKYQVFPELDKAVEDALRASIKLDGVIYPVVVDQNADILDGHHRSRLADELGVSYDIKEMHVSSDEDRLRIIETLNMDRRHMNKAERRKMVIKLRRDGHPFRGIAGALGIGIATAVRDARVPHGTPDAQSGEEKEESVNSSEGATTGVDGKRYPSIRDERPDCPKCGGSTPQKVGTKEGVQWWRCRSCRRYFREGGRVVPDKKDRQLQIAELANAGNTKEQIARSLGLHPKTVGIHAANAGINIPSAATGNLNPTHFIAVTVTRAAALLAGKDAVDYCVARADLGELDSWVVDLREAIAFLNGLIKKLKEERDERERRQQSN